MDKFMAFMDRHIVPYAAKIGAQRHLVAIRDAFLAMIALTMVGSVAVLINNIPFDPYQEFMVKVFGEGWKTLTGDIWFGTLALMALFLVMGIAYNLAKSYNEDGLQSALIAVASFFILIPQTATITPEVGEAVSGWGLIALKYLGTEALFTAIVVALFTTEVFVRLSKVKQLIIKLPAGVPPAVSRSFAKLIPGMFTLVAVGLVGLGLHLLGQGSLTDLINHYVGVPLSNIADSLPSALFIVLMVHGLWFVGLHGANIALPFTETILMKLGAENAALVVENAPLDQFNVLAGPFFDVFVYLGGSGMLLALLIAIAIAGRRRRKDMLALGLAPSCFNINEPVIFGLPIVLNPIYGIPFVLTPLITTVTSYLAISSGLVHPVITAKLPWTIPPVIGGFLATGHVSGALLALVNLTIGILIYIPFIIIAERIDAKNAQQQH
ncbi:MAG: PTS sugar transporter subunit IIC [Cellulosilyticaceae bacterium]